MNLFFPPRYDTVGKSDPVIPDDVMLIETSPGAPLQLRRGDLRSRRNLTLLLIELYRNMHIHYIVAVKYE